MFNGHRCTLLVFKDQKKKHSLITTCQQNKNSLQNVLQTDNYTQQSKPLHHFNNISKAKQYCVKTLTTSKSKVEGALNQTEAARERVLPTLRTGFFSQSPIKNRL